MKNISKTAIINSLNSLPDPNKYGLDYYEIIISEEMDFTSKLGISHILAFEKRYLSNGRYEWYLLEKRK